MINRALKLLRIYHNFKQKDLALRLGISASHLCEIEAGDKSVSFDLLEKYAAVFGIPVSTIALFAEAASAGGRPNLQTRLTSNALRLLEWLDTITQAHDDKESAKVLRS